MGSEVKQERHGRLRLIRRLTQWLDAPMAALSFLFLASMLGDLLVADNSPWRPWLDQASLVLWSLFALEFLVKLAIAPDKPTYLKRHWFDILVLALPMVRVLRAVPMARAFGSAKYFSLFRLGSATRRSMRALGQFLRASRFTYVGGLTGIVVVVTAGAMRLLERGAPGAHIKSFGDALWWSAALVTTVGSDLEPVTPAGKLLAVLLMVFGVAVFGYFVSQAVTVIQDIGGKPPGEKPPSTPEDRARARRRVSITRLESPQATRGIKR